MAIINRGHLVAHGSLDELRAGVRARIAATEHNSAHNPAHPATLNGNATLTLEQIFLAIVGTESVPQHTEGELAWLS